MLAARVSGQGGAGGLRLSARGQPLPHAHGNRLQVPLVLAPGTTTVDVSGTPSSKLIAPTVIAGAFEPFLRGVSGGPLTGIVGPPCRSVQPG
jgi:hypothetical protein